MRHLKRDVLLLVHVHLQRVPQLIDIQLLLSRCSPSRSTSSLPHCPSLSAMSCTSASPRVIQPWRPSSSRLIQHGHDSSSTAAWELWPRNWACHTTRVTSTSICVQAACVTLRV